MRYRPTQEGDTRVHSWFAVVPVRIGDEERVWERVTVLQEFYRPANTASMILEARNLAFIDEGDDPQKVMEGIRRGGMKPPPPAYKLPEGRTEHKVYEGGKPVTVNEKRLVDLEALAVLAWEVGLISRARCAESLGTSLADLAQDAERVKDQRERNHNEYLDRHFKDL
jgi:hypothetical protein